MHTFKDIFVLKALAGIFFAGVFWAMQSNAFAQSENLVLQSGEELTYKVKYGFLRLGTVTVKTERDASAANNFKLVLKMDSSVPFYDLHEYDESVVSASQMMSNSFFGMHSRSSKKIETQFHYDSTARRAYFQRKDLNTGLMMQSNTMENATPYVEGPTMFFYGRWQSRSKQLMKIPTMVDGHFNTTTLDFNKGRAYLNIDAVDHHVRTRKYEGWTEGDSVSSIGMTGMFTVWVSDDDAAVPMRMEMNISVGSISMELEKWTRIGWEPPS